MYCQHCGSLLNGDTTFQFCPHCGKPIQASPQMIKLKCKSCGGEMEFNSDDKILKCKFCGSKELFIESDAVATERIRSQTKIDIEHHRINTYKDIEQEKLSLKRAQLENDEKRIEAESFLKGNFKFTIIIFGIIAALGIATGFHDRKIICGIIAIIQLCGLVVSFLMGAKMIKEPFKGFYIILAIISFVAVIPYMSFW